MDVRVTFDGATGTVTGSRYVLRAGRATVVVDAGLFQGTKELRERNWQTPPFRPAEVDAVLLTHAHLDHCGYLPRLVREGFHGSIYATRATHELAGIVLLDAAKLQEEDAAYANRKRFTRHAPALPLFTVEDARAALRRFRGIDYHQWITPADGVRARFTDAGHILGSASILVEAGDSRVVFSGDIGRYGVPLHVDPEPPAAADAVVIESTYGNRTHDTTPLEDVIRGPVAETAARGGTVLVPSFAVARTQLLLVMLGDLMRSGALPQMPIDIDSPMASAVTEVYERYARTDELDADVAGDGWSRLMPPNLRFHRSVDESKQLNYLPGPRIIISASGMLAGGRVLHHARRLLPDEKNLVLLVGFQAAGTRGRALEDGAPTLRIHGADVPVRARVICAHSLSAHADAGELLRWIGSAAAAPRAVFVTHGEPDAAEALATRLRDDAGLRAHVPAMGEVVDVGELARDGEPPAEAVAAAE
jgi:metallo-beta-lactamase family protein